MFYNNRSLNAELTSSSQLKVSGEDRTERSKLKS